MESPGQAHGVAGIVEQVAPGGGVSLERGQAEAVVAPQIGRQGTQPGGHGPAFPREIGGDDAGHGANPAFVLGGEPPLHLAAHAVGQGTERQEDRNQNGEEEAGAKAHRRGHSHGAIPVDRQGWGALPDDGMGPGVDQRLDPCPYGQRRQLMAGRRDLARKSEDVAPLMLVAKCDGKLRWIQPSRSQRDGVLRQRDDAFRQSASNLVLTRICDARRNWWSHHVGLLDVRALTVPPEWGLGRARLPLSHVFSQGSIHRVHAQDPNRQSAGRLEQGIGATPGECERRELRPVGDVVDDRRITGDHQIGAAVEGVAGIGSGLLEVEGRAVAIGSASWR